MLETAAQLPEWRFLLTGGSEPVVNLFQEFCNDMNVRKVILVAAENPDALAAGIRQAVQDKERSRKIAEKAARDAVLFTDSHEQAC